MKKFFVIIALLLSFCAVSAIEISDTTQTLSEKSFTNSVDAPQYWNGWVKRGGSAGRGHVNDALLYISVYRIDNQCDSFYAVATEYKSSPHGKRTEIYEELIVKYDSKNRLEPYYVTYMNDKYYFKME